MLYRVSGILHTGSDSLTDERSGKRFSLRIESENPVEAMNEVADKLEASKISLGDIKSLQVSPMVISEDVGGVKLLNQRKRRTKKQIADDKAKAAATSSVPSDGTVTEQASATTASDQSATKGEPQTDNPGVTVPNGGRTATTGRKK